MNINCKAQTERVSHFLMMEDALEDKPNGANTFLGVVYITFVDIPVTKQVSGMNSVSKCRLSVPFSCGGSVKEGKKVFLNSNPVFTKGIILLHVSWQSQDSKLDYVHSKPKVKSFLPLCPYLSFDPLVT